MNRLLLNKINKHRIISFDVFDTLLERKVSLPKDIFCLVGQTVLNGENSFVQDRIEAEAKAREKSLSGEVTLDDIYHVLSYKYGDKTSQLMEEEIRQEIDNSIPKESILPFYRHAIKNGKKVIIISDMYLSSEIIGKMLKKNGINEYSYLFVSNEHGCDKRSGRLFNIAIETLGVSREELLHIGDSLSADFRGAKKAHVDTHLIRRKNRVKRLLFN